MTTIYEAAGGAEGLLALAQEWHRLAYSDPVISHAFTAGTPQDPDGVRIAAYWAEALGGPDHYSRVMGGETAAVRAHAGNGSHLDFDARGEELFERAVDECGYTGELAATLKAYFRWANLAMTSYPAAVDDVPDGLSVPHWDWDGPVSGTSNVREAREPRHGDVR